MNILRDNLLSGEFSLSRNEPKFCVQKHDATNLHYDFRLEVDGTLKSWAVPKGPSLNTAHKRLAVQVGDHSLGYLDYEGVIAAGYGAGAVLVWDIGTWENLSPIPAGKALQQGKLIFRLKGTKLHGAFSLIRMGPVGSKNWLLRKMPDEFADRSIDIVFAKPQSAITGRTLERLRGDDERGDD
jgi:bifunctional non-homologous end joining protein LigD